MASLALSVVGFAVGGPFGAQLGAVVGGVIDSFIFAPGATEGPRLTDLSVSTSTYGQPIPLIYGPENRISGNTIWSSGLLETVTEVTAGKGGPAPSQNVYTYRVSFAMAFSGRPANLIKRVWMNSKLVFDYYNATTPIAPPTSLVGMVVTRGNGTHAVFDTLRFYQGNGTQQIDPTIEGYLGTADTPAYRHTAYMVITDLQLADYGNVLPNIEVEFEADTQITDAGVVADICGRANVGVISTSTLDSDVDGYAVGRAGSAYSAIQPLALAYSFDVVEQWGQIRAIRRGGGLKGTLTIPDMGAKPVGSNADDPYRFLRANDTTLPKEVTVSFRDASVDYQVNTQTAKRQFGSADSNISVGLAVTMTPDAARRVADRILWGAWAGRRTAQLSVSDRWVRRNPGDMMGIQVAGNILPFKIIRSTRGANAVISWDLQYEDPEVYRSEAFGAAANMLPNFIRYPGPTRLVMMNAPLLRSADDDSGFYWAVEGVQDGWRGANILRSTDGGLTYGQMSAVGVRSVIGDVAAALPPGPTAYWDRGNVLTVELDRPSQVLESVSELEVLDGANAFWLGGTNGIDGEIGQFATADLVAPGTYALSDLLRGRQGTEYAAPIHGPNEVFVLLGGSSLGRSDFGPSDWDKARRYKPVSILTTEAETGAVDFTGTGEAVRPHSPVHIVGSRDVSNNLTVSWVRRTRLFTPGFGGGPVPLGEQSEAYEVDIFTVSGAPVRTLSSTVPSVLYTAAQQTADGITPGNPVDLEVFQLSASRGRGRGGHALV